MFNGFKVYIFLTKIYKSRVFFWVKVNFKVYVIYCVLPFVESVKGIKYLEFV